MKCQHCKWWKRDIGWDFVNRKRIEDPTIVMGDCSCDKLKYADSDHVIQDGLIYWDVECYSAGMKTGQDFGCVHFESK